MRMVGTLAFGRQTLDSKIIFGADTVPTRMTTRMEVGDQPSPRVEFRPTRRFLLARTMNDNVITEECSLFDLSFVCFLMNIVRRLLSFVCFTIVKPTP